VALWWIYFDHSANFAAEKIAESKNPGALARSAYTYLHAIMVAGIIVTAVGDELSIAHPTGDAHIEVVLVLAGGPALFLLGHLLFKYAVWRIISMQRVVAIAALLGLMLVGTLMPPIAVALIATAITFGVVLVDGDLIRFLPQSEREHFKAVPAE
jgi:low temperature requirement protein LtrA